MGSRRRTWPRPAAWLGLLAIALAVRLPFVLRVGPNEGGGDEWYAAWRSWCVLFERDLDGQREVVKPGDALIILHRQAVDL